MIQFVFRVIMFIAYILNILAFVRLFRKFQVTLPKIQEGTEAMTEKEKLMHFTKNFTGKFVHLLFACFGFLAISIICCFLNGNHVVDDYIGFAIIFGLLAWVITHYVIYLIGDHLRKKYHVDLTRHYGFMIGRRSDHYTFFFICAFIGLIFGINSTLVSYTVILRVML